MFVQYIFWIFVAVGLLLIASVPLLLLGYRRRRQRSDKQREKVAMLKVVIAFLLTGLLFLVWGVACLSLAQNVEQ